MKKLNYYIVLILFVLNTGCTNSQNFKSVDVAEFKTTLEKTTDAQLLDVRTPGEFAGGHISNAKNMDWNGSDFDTQVANLDKEKPVFVYCLSGGRSKKAASHLKDLGFKNIIELNGGYLAWSKANANTNEAWIGMTKEAYNQLLVSDKIVVIDFYAEWCAPCKKMAPYLDKMSKELADKVIIHRIDADKNKSLFNALGYEGLPVVLVYKNGKETFKKNQFVSEEELRKAL
ncbi:Thioredoxin family protein [Flavobacterium indicum GPTSA100-9 = DSM 17447]|uniref:Thioredoxin family protein n=1 Tax=Flavobacterium indicum (strain DSM 17447 / CIP 109464 / GPTSA100-9) TaxID=1094466 RepID=H8XVT6_FLAIG|nr:thioredoxin domain-containing protein [Flavobacterium indicum]CCG54050.1 Thioredoxin family protein [Flavobacterium indicum GPTSA100-9 = DSM 17447]